MQNNELGLKTILLDVQYLVFVLWLTGKSNVSTNWNLFLVIFILSIGSLLLIPGLLVLAYKNTYWPNKFMNLALSGAFLCGFGFCLSFRKYFNHPSEDKILSETFLAVGIALIATYAYFKNTMSVLYYNLIGLLFIENDFRHSKYAFKTVNLLNNFVDMPKLNYTDKELYELSVNAE